MKGTREGERKRERERERERVNERDGGIETNRQNGRLRARRKKAGE